MHLSNLFTLDLLTLADNESGTETHTHLWQHTPTWGQWLAPAVGPWLLLGPLLPFVARSALGYDWEERWSWALSSSSLSSCGSHRPPGTAPGKTQQRPTMVPVWVPINFGMAYVAFRCAPIPPALARCSSVCACHLLVKRPRLPAMPIVPMVPAGPAPAAHAVPAVAASTATS